MTSPRSVFRQRAQLDKIRLIFLCDPLHLCLSLDPIFQPIQTALTQPFPLVFGNRAIAPIATFHLP